jgi:hypothetical protein
MWCLLVRDIVLREEKFGVVGRKICWRRMNGNQQKKIKIKINILPTPNENQAHVWMRTHWQRRRRAIVLLTKCTMPASSKVRNDNLGRTAGVAAWAA